MVGTNMSRRKVPTDSASLQGQEFSERRDFSLGLTQVVSSLADVADIRVDHDINDFAEIFFANMPDTSVTVVSLISRVFIITRFLHHYSDDFGAREGGRLRTAY